MSDDDAVEITGDTEAWWDAFERGECAAAWDAQQAAIAHAAAQPLAVDQPQTAELMRLRPTLDASES